MSFEFIIADVGAVAASWPLAGWWEPLRGIDECAHASEHRWLLHI
jgi:hypothetical protein